MEVQEKKLDAACCGPGALRDPPLPAKNRPAPHPHQVSAIFSRLATFALCARGSGQSARPEGEPAGGEARFPVPPAPGWDPRRALWPPRPPRPGEEGSSSACRESVVLLQQTRKELLKGPSWLDAGGDVPGVCGRFVVTDTRWTRGWTRPRPRGPTADPFSSVRMS